MLEPNQLQPGAITEDGDPIRLQHEDGGAPVTVVDTMYGTRGAYLVVTSDELNGLAMLAPQSYVTENFHVSDDTSDTDPDGDEIDNLQGDDLDNAIHEAGIDPSTGGSRQDGSLSAQEKRDALRAHRDQEA